MNDGWENGLREKMSEYSEPVPEGLWERISAAAAKRRRRMLAWRCGGAVSAAAAAAALFAVFSGGGAPSADRKSGLADVIAVQESHENGDAAGTHPEPEANELPHLGTDLIAAAEPVSAATSDPTVAERTESVADPAAADNSSAEKPIQKLIDDYLAGKPAQNKTEEFSSEKPAQKESDGPSEGKPVRNTSDSNNASDNHNAADGRVSMDEYLASLDDGEKERRKAGFSVGLLASGGGSTSDFTSGIGIRPSVAFVSTAMSMPVDGRSSNMVTLLNANRETSDRTVFRMPVNYGLSLSFRIAPRWSLETGLLYTLLSSTETCGGESSYFTYEQKIGYVGVPLGIQYDIVQGRRLRLYVTAGGAFRMAVSQDLRRNDYIGRQLSATEHLDMETAPSVFSVNAAAGLQFTFAKRMSLYAEPGAARYFPAASGVRTVYTEKPLNFNLTAGLRFNFGRPSPEPKAKR